VNRRALHGGTRTRSDAARDEARNNRRWARHRFRQLSQFKWGATQLSKTYDELKRAEYLRNSANVSTVIGPGVTFKGDLSAAEDLLLEGKFEGMIQLTDSALTVGATGRIRADIVAREVVVYGEVIGNVSARDRIEVKREGSIVGDLNTQRIVIEDGANFRGSMEIVGITNSPQDPPLPPSSVPPSGDEPPQGRAATAGS